MSCGGCCQDFVTCCTYNCSMGQPVTTSGPAVCAAECATIGTPDTISALVSSGLCALTAAVASCKPKAPAKTAVKAQAQAGSTTNSTITWVLIGLAALAAFFLLGKQL